MSEELTYPKTVVNKVNRYNDRAHYDTTTIHQIINTTPVLHVSFLVPSTDSSAPLPTILPMIGQMGSYSYPSSDESDPLDCYLHGYVSSRIMNFSRSSREGIPLCVAATKIDGLVLSLTPNSHSYNYRSAILHGRAVVVDDPEEKVYAMKLITNSVVSERWENTRTPPNNAEMESTCVLRMNVSSASAKIRTGPPGNDKKDLENEELRNRVWTGVIPVWLAFGEPVGASDNLVPEVPEYVRRHVERSTERERKYAEGAGKEK